MTLSHSHTGQRADAGLLGPQIVSLLDLRRGQPGDRERVALAARTIALADTAGAADLHQRWRWLAELGRLDLVVGRLAEGHADAVAILESAGRQPVAEAFYGVWASASGGTGLRAEPTLDGWQLTGSMRFCTGARCLDRALVTARATAGELLLFDAAVAGPGWRPVEGTWPAVGMDLSDSLDVDVNATVRAAAQVGPAGYYLDRPGFALGGIGVAAVWLGGAAGVLDTIASGLHRFAPNPHQLAHLGAMSAAVTAAADVLSRIAQDQEPVGRTDEAAAGDVADEAEPDVAPDLAAIALRARCTVDDAVRLVLDRAPRLTGPGPLCRDADFAHRMADLLVYARQHHGERDQEALGRAVLDGRLFGIEQ